MNILAARMRFSEKMIYKILKQGKFQVIFILNFIGLGSYAIVKYAVHKSTGLEVAIKSYNKSKLQDPMKNKSVEREITILQNLQHPNIIKIYNVVDT